MRNTANSPAPEVDATNRDTDFETNAITIAKAVSGANADSYATHSWSMGGSRLGCLLHN
jgi:hypothetical protein